jgi:hypothetical protein
VATAGDGGGGHTLAVKPDGSVWSWGRNSSGQLGNGNTTQQLSPVQVSQATGMTNVVAVSAGPSHNLAVTATGTVWGWGYNGYSQLGTAPSPVTSPVQIPGLTDVVAVAAGSHTSLALKRDGTVMAWGQGDYGTLGDGTFTSTRATPALVSRLTGISSIAMGEASGHAHAVKTDGAASGSLWSWGYGGPGYGYLFNGATDNRNIPIRTMDGAVAVSAGTHTVLALIAEAVGPGSIWGTGYHSANTIEGSSLPHTTTAPVRLVRGNFSTIATGREMQSAVGRDLKLVSWGTTTGGHGFALGDGSFAAADPDGDGLPTSAEWEAGTDPWTADTNGDGIMDGASVRSGQNATNPDMDGDGVQNVVERQRGTDPFNPDTDGDLSGDAVDCFPLDRTRWLCPTPPGGDVTPPVITLAEPTNASLISSVP